MQLIVELVSTNISELVIKDSVEAILIGTDLSYDAAVSLAFNDIKKIVEECHAHGKKVIVNVNRLFLEDEVNEITRRLMEYLHLGVDYFLYTDMLVYQVLGEIKATEQLIYYAPTYMTNYYDVNYMLDKNKTVVLSHLLSYDEWLVTIKCAHRPLVIYTFGLPNIFYSRRPLVSNYYQYRNLNIPDSFDKHYLKEELRDGLMLIEEKKMETMIYESAYYYLEDELKNVDQQHLLLITTKGLSYQQMIEVTNGYEKLLLNPTNKLILPNDINISKSHLAHHSILLKECD